MARYTRAWGNNGSDRDHLGVLPTKRVEKIVGADVNSRNLIPPIELSVMIRDFYDKNRKKPQILRYPGSSDVSTLSIIVNSLGYVSLRVNSNAKRLEMA